MSAVRFSVIITCFNQKNYIRAAVDSALAQTHPLKEIIVVDDGSEDGSRYLLEQYSDAIRLSAFSQNQGAIEARNHGAALARGEYLVFLDGDDLLTPWALDSYEKVIEGRSPQLVLGCATWFEGNTPPELNEQDRPATIEFAEYPSLMAKDRSIWLSASVLVVKRELFHRVGGWTSGIFHMDLFDIVAKLGQAGRAICIFSPSTTLYRVHPGNSRNDTKAFLDMALQLVQKEKNGIYPRDLNFRLQRRAWFGGMVGFWIKMAATSGLFREAALLAFSGIGMVLSAIIRKLEIRVKGRSDLFVLELPHSAPAVDIDAQNC